MGPTVLKVIYLTVIGTDLQVTGTDASDVVWWWRWTDSSWVRIR